MPVLWWLPQRAILALQRVLLQHLVMIPLLLPSVLLPITIRHLTLAMILYHLLVRLGQRKQALLSLM